MHSAFSPIFPDPGNHVLQAGQRLFGLGQTVTDVFLVRSGRVALERHTPHGQRLVFQSAGAGTVLAEPSTYSEHYYCDAVAIEPSRVASVPRSTFLAILTRDPAMATAWATALARSVHAARLRAEIRTLPRLADRLDAWLDAGNRLPTKGQWQAIADELGVTREAFYRELSRRRRQGSNLAEHLA